MTFIQENWPDLLEPGLRKVFADVFNRQESMLAILFSMQESTKAIEHDLEMGDIADFEPFEGSIPYDDTGEGYKTDYTHLEYARGIKIERRLVLNDQYSVINRRPAALGLAAYRRREADGASVLNNAFNGAVVGGDGLSLCNAAHTSKVGGSNQSNISTDSFSPTAVETARENMTQFKSNRDNIITVKPDMLIVPLQLEEKAFELINSKGKVDTAQNNANFHQGKYKLVVWPNYLTAPTKWWFVDSELMKMFLLWFDREAVQFFKDRDFDTLQAKYAGYAYYSFGWSDWRWVLGSNA